MFKKFCVTKYIQENKKPSFEFRTKSDTYCFISVIYYPIFMTRNQFEKSGLFQFTKAL